MENSPERLYPTGSRVILRPGFGTEAPITVTVAGHGEKRGRPLIDYTGHPDGLPHWAYVAQIVRVADDDGWTSRVQAYEAEGMTTSDAQACADADDRKAGRPRYAGSILPSALQFLAVAALFALLALSTFNLAPQCHAHGATLHCHMGAS